MLSPAELSRLATALGGLPILGCLGGSPADLAGIRYGDILLSIDGTPTPSWADFFAARRASTTRSITVRVFRQGTEFDAVMELPSHSRSPREVLDELQSRDLLPRGLDPRELSLLAKSSDLPS